MAPEHTVFESLDEVRAAVGQRLGVSEWIDVTQDQVDRFAEATGDRQWIHVDVDRARAESPFGGPIAHGFLSLSLTNRLLPTIVEVRGVSLGVNYGTGKVRFPTPVPVPSRIRAVADLVGCDEIAGGVQTTMRVTVEVDAGEGVAGDKPACVVEALSRWLE